MADTKRADLEEFTSLRKLKGKKQTPKLVTNDDDATEENSESSSPFEPPKRNKFAAAIRTEEFHKEAMKKYARGVDLPSKESLEKVKDRRLKKTLDDARTMALNAARAEMLLVEEPGFLEAENDKEKTYNVLQEEIYKAVDLQTSRKMFSLSLTELGPYSFDYDLTGRHLAIGGKKGHIAVFDWARKNLSCEIQVRERITDVKFLHTSNMFAVAQLKHTYIYNDSGVELHCLKSHNEPQILEFLPYHYLLVSLSRKGFITYQDVSTGQLVKQIRSYTTPLCMRQNPHNAVIHIGNTHGTVSLWTPNSKDPAIKMLCHKGAVTSMAIHRNGVHMATSGTDGRLKLWDLRTFKPVHEYFTYHGATSLDFSQRGLLASGRLGKVEIWKDVYGEKQKEPYMMLNLSGEVQDLHFCPFEDILGVGHSKGFDSSVVPGSGEPNLDSFEANPYSNSKQKNESEVKKLLEKLRPDMIALDPDSIIQIKQKGKEDLSVVDNLEDKLLKDESTTSEERKEILSEKKLRKIKKKEAAIKQQEKQKEMWSFRDRMNERQKEKKRKIEEQDNNAVPSSQVLDRFKRKKN